MVVRLSVVMVHSAPATATAERVAQGVVGELIGLSGIDLILVAPLDSLSETSTDRLTLSSLDGDIAVLDWSRPEVTHASLKRIGIEGLRTRHAADLEVVADAVDPDAQPPRKLYFFNLMEFTDPERVISSLVKLNQARAVRTFSLAPIIKRPESSDPAAGGDSRSASASVSGVAPITNPVENPRMKAVAEDDSLQQQVHAKSPTHKQAPFTQRAAEVSPFSDPDDQDLDALIDQLDQLDP